MNYNRTYIINPRSRRFKFSVRADRFDSINQGCLCAGPLSTIVLQVLTSQLKVRCQLLYEFPLLKKWQRSNYQENYRDRVIDN